MSDLEITREETLAELPRGRDGSEVLRVRQVDAASPEGRDISWTDIREFYRGDDGQWRPGKRGIAIRARELRPVVDALRKVVAGDVVSSSAPREAEPPFGSPTQVTRSTSRGAQRHLPLSAPVAPPPEYDGPTDEECGF